MWISDREGATGPVDAAELRWLASWVERIAVPRNFWAEPAVNRALGRVLAEALSGWGYDVCFQGDYRNVVALPRRRGAEGMVLVGAHYDSVPRSPGADDNASGVAVLLACARALAASDGLAQPVGFVAFNAEEDGLLGSRDFVLRGAEGLGVRPRLVHVLEMVGFRTRCDRSQRLPFAWTPRSLSVGDFVGLLANGAARADLDALRRSTARPRPRCVSLQQFVAMDSLLPALRRSDHFPFWEAEIPALLWTDTAEMRNPHYHQTTDTPDTLDYAFMSEVTNLLVTSLRAPGPSQSGRRAT